jgi:hypothetical protein
MARRTKDWNEDLAKDLRNSQFARQFLLKKWCQAKFAPIIPITLPRQLEKLVPT